MSMNTTRRIQGQIQSWWRPVLGILFISCSKQSIPHFIFIWSSSLLSGWSFNINWDKHCFLLGPSVEGWTKEWFKELGVENLCELTMKMMQKANPHAEILRLIPIGAIVPGNCICLPTYLFFLYFYHSLMFQMFKHILISNIAKVGTMKF